MSEGANTGRTLRFWAPLATLAGTSLVLGACATASVSGTSPELPLWTKRPSFNLQVIYSRNAVAASRRAGEPYERGQPEIDPKGRRVFVGSSDRGLYALHAEDGSALWRFETLGFVQCQPLYDAASDAVYFGSNDGALYRVSAKNGALSWRVYRDLEGEGRFVERYIVESWADYVRLRSRMTVSDRALQQRAQDLQKKDVPVRVSRFLGVG